MERLFAAIVLTLAVCTVGTAFAAEVYRWTDDDGQVHYSSTPPSDREVTVIEVTDEGTPLSSSAASDSATATDDEAAAQRREHCETARHNLEILEDESIETFLDADGETISFDADERAALLEETQAQVQYFCR